MKKYTCDLQGAVQHLFAPVLCKIQGAHRTLRQSNYMSPLVNASARSPAGHPLPPLLRPALWTNSISMPPWAHDFGRFRRVTAQLPRLSASKAGLSEAAQEAIEAKFGDQLHALRRGASLGFKQCACCKGTFELYCFPYFKSFPRGHLHYCVVCRANLRRQNNAPVGEADVIPAISHKQCTKCGVLRASAWFAKGPSKEGLQAHCRLCANLRGLELREMHKVHREAQAPITEKQCSACEKTLPASHFSKHYGIKDGHQGMCKACGSIKMGARLVERRIRSKNGTLVLAIGKERVCSECNTCKLWTDFQFSLQTNVGIDDRCKQCRNNHQRLLYSRQKIDRYSA